MWLEALELMDSDLHWLLCQPHQKFWCQVRAGHVQDDYSLMCRVQGLSLCADCITFLDICMESSTCAHDEQSCVL